MKSIDNGIDLGMGLLIVVLCISTALYGLVSYSKLDLYNGLQDKNTADIEGSLQPSDDVATKSIHDLTVALVAAAQNRDNIRQLSIIIKHKVDTDSYIFEDNYSLIENYRDTRKTIDDAMAEYAANSSYGSLLMNGHYQAFVTSDQSNITCYFLVE